jgi:hypothetical protein
MQSVRIEGGRRLADDKRAHSYFGATYTNILQRVQEFVPICISDKIVTAQFRFESK